MAIVLLDKINFKSLLVNSDWIQKSKNTETVTREKEEHYILIKGSTDTKKI